MYMYMQEGIYFVFTRLLHATYCSDFEDRTATPALPALTADELPEMRR